MNPSVSKSTRDTAFYAVATLVSSAIGHYVHVDATASAAIGVVVFAALSFGWRVLRHFAPWVDSEE
jgi:hypothetical protein